MREFSRPRVFCSRCLEFDHCRYNGDVISNPFVKSLESHVEFITLCPECEIGLGVPRKPIRLAMEGESLRLFQPSTGLDYTDRMNDLARSWLGGAGTFDGFIFKFRSPSCGPGNVKVYYSKAPDAGSHMKGSGLFAAMAAEGHPFAVIEDEGRLHSFSIREHFLTRIFASAELRKTGESGSMGKMVDFHSRMKYLLMGYSQTGLRTLGKIVANHEGHSLARVVELYREAIAEVMGRPPKYTSMINAVMHMFGGVSKNLSPAERAFFLESIEEYRDERIPLSTLLHTLKAWAVRFSNSYLLNQILLEPFPKSLVEISDSGKGRKV